MSQTFIWRPLSGIHNPLDRPQDYTSQRQELAKVNGRTHFQLAPNIMAPALSVSNSFSVPSSSLDFWGYHHPQQLPQYSNNFITESSPLQSIPLASRSPLRSLLHTRPKCGTLSAGSFTFLCGDSWSWSRPKQWTESRYISFVRRFQR